MKPATLLLIAFAGLAVAQEEPRLEKATEKAPADQVLRDSNKAPWLGLTVARLEDAVRAHVPAIPAGFGFVVSAVDPGSPADKAGVKPYDVFWKFGDQWIANEAQLFALVRLHQVGDEVVLGMFRSGEALNLPVVLARIPADQLLGKLPPLDAAVLPAGQQNLPLKVLNPADRSAAIETADGKAVLSLVDGEAEVKILASSGETIYEGPVNDLAGVSLVPDPWKPRVGALERALAHAMKGSLAPRLPRPRAAAPEQPAAK